MSGTDVFWLCLAGLVALIFAVVGYAYLWVRSVGAEGRAHEDELEEYMDSRGIGLPMRSTKEEDVA